MHAFVLLAVICIVYVFVSVRLTRSEMYKELSVPIPLRGSTATHNVSPRNRTHGHSLLDTIRTINRGRQEVQVYNYRRELCTNL